MRGVSISNRRRAFVLRPSAAAIVPLIARTGAVRICAAALAVVALASTSSSAATRYVAKNGVCAHHLTTIGGSFVSCTDSKTAGCTAAKPCCTIQDAADKATASGDVVEIHDGTFTDPTGFTDTSGSYTFLNAKFAARLNTAGVTVHNASGDVPVLDLGTTNHMGLLVAKNGITVDGLTITGGIGGSDTSRVAHILVSGDSGALVSGAMLRNNTLIVGTSNHVGSTSGNMCIKLDNSGGFIVEKNTCTGGWDFSFWVYSSNTNGGAVIRNNTQIGDGRGAVGTQRGIMLEMLGNQNDGGVALVYGNTLDQSPTSGITYGMYLRELHWSVYVFNNIIRGVNGYGIFFQDDLCTGSPSHYHIEKWKIFNNTFVAGPGGASTGIKWPGCVEADVRNNLFSGFGSGTELRSDCPTQICTTRDDNPRSTSDATFAYDLCYGQSSCVNLLSGNPITQSNLVTGLDPLLDATGHILSASSGAVDRATNNPIGQGPGLCSVTSGTVTADCTKDIDGDQRGAGAGWDIGADELGSGSAPSPPATPQNVRRIDKH